MAWVYYDLIKKGLKTFAQVNSRYKEAVKNLFKADVQNGAITEEQYEEYIGEPYSE